MQRYRLLFFVTFLFSIKSFSQTNFNVSSPDKKINVTAWVDSDAQARYQVSYGNQIVLKESKLGLTTADNNFSEGLRFVGASPVSVVRDSYQLYTGKKSNINYTANRRSFELKNGDGLPINIVFQVSNDGVAFRYVFPRLPKGETTVTAENTSFHFDTTAKAFLQPMQESKTGWEKTNPAYEEHYQQNIPVTKAAPTKAGWAYPALFQSGNTWVLITEADVDSNYCATRLQAASPDGEYSIGFPDPREVFPGGGYLPSFSSTKSIISPWRIITIGTLKTIVESTLGTDLAKPSIRMDKSFIQPGKSSWSWIMSKDDSIVYTEQVRYIDLALKMNWQYCLVDAAWDRKIGYEKIKELSAYAKSKNVGLLLWYNSAGDWNTVKYTPKNKLLTHESRVKEFGLLKEIGVKGVKIDFFGGDGQSVMKYYHEILQDAATHGLMVNFHGATLPRGWHRTYPNLLTTEAVRGFEMITFNQSDADVAANHCAMLPFTRNAFDPMDFTPMNLYKIPTRVKRKTTSAFELATAVLFLSGIQHFAESPAGMTHVPEKVQDFLKELPNQWDDVKFIDGYPGKFVVIARKAGNRWYVAGINGEASERTIKLNFSELKKNKATLITDGNEPLSFETKEMSSSAIREIRLMSHGGFVAVLEN